MSANIKILYVDDEKINLELFEINYEDVFDVVKATSGVEGLKKCKEIDDIAVVVSDMKMPHMNGIEFIEKIKEFKKDLPCFILTGFDMNDQIKDALETNLIQKYFSKPFDLDEMETAIREFAKS